MGVILDGIATAVTPPEVANISASEIGASSATIGGESLQSGTKLSNDGEQITLRNHLGELVQQVTSNDVSPWP